MTSRTRSIASKKAAEQDESTTSSSSSSNWQQEGSMYYLLPDNAVCCDEVHAFDLDSTLIKTKSGRVFSTGRHDWQWWDPSVPERLRQLHESGKKVVIFTNQQGVSKGHVGLKEIQGKLGDICKGLSFTPSIFMATGADSYRKPSTGMWRYMVEYCNDDIQPDLSECIYVGDMAGRISGWDGNNAKKDKTCSDRKFADNLKIHFQTPDEYFLGQPEAPFMWQGIDPRTIPDDSQEGVEICEGGVESLVSDSQELIVCVGSPASGKSQFSRTRLANYTRVNQDTLGTKERCVSAAAAALERGESVVIDNTNPDADVRALYLKLAKKHKIPARCFWFQTPPEVAEHLNNYREIATNGERKRVPSIAFGSFRKRFQAPSVAEGFTEVKKINFVCSFRSDEERERFQQWSS